MTRPIELAKALADKNRLRIIKLLEGRDLCVCQILPLISGPASGVSRNLAILRKAGLLAARRDGRWIRYQLNYDGVDALGRQILGLIAGWLNDDQQILKDRKALQSIMGVPIEDICRKKRGRP